MAFSEDLAPADLRHGLTLLLTSDGGEQLLATYPDLEDDDYDITTLPAHVKNMVVNILARNNPDFELPPTYYTALQKRQSLAFARAAEAQNQAHDLESGAQDQVQDQNQAQPVTSPRAAHIFQHLGIVNPSAEHANEVGIYGVSQITDYEVYLRDLQRGRQRPVRVRVSFSRVWQRGTPRSQASYAIVFMVALVLGFFGLSAVMISYVAHSPASLDPATKPAAANLNPAANTMNPGNEINKLKARAEMVNAVLEVSADDIHYGLQKAGNLLRGGEWEKLDAYLKRVLAQQDGHLVKLNEIKNELNEEDLV